MQGKQWSAASTRHCSCHGSNGQLPARGIAAVREGRVSCQHGALQAEQHRHGSQGPKPSSGFSQNGGGEDCMSQSVQREVTTSNYHRSTSAAQVALLPTLVPVFTPDATSGHTNSAWLSSTQRMSGASFPASPPHAGQCWSRNSSRWEVFVSTPRPCASITCAAACGRPTCAARAPSPSSAAEATSAVTPPAAATAEGTAFAAAATTATRVSCCSPPSHPASQSSSLVLSSLPSSPSPRIDRERPLPPAAAKAAGPPASSLDSSGSASASTSDAAQQSLDGAEDGTDSGSCLNAGCKAGGCLSVAGGCASAAASGLAAADASSGLAVGAAASGSVTAAAGSPATAEGAAASASADGTADSGGGATGPASCSGNAPAVSAARTSMRSALQPLRTAMVEGLPPADAVPSLPASPRRPPATTTPARAAAIAATAPRAAA
eukprot:230955-Chlamydomonas_euryale.AAC.7